uniref:NADH dehydrogenase subunit 1 n=1 Tax=Parascaris univalens TaxID=6257 RepID=A0A915AZ31_PARUN
AFSFAYVDRPLLQLEARKLTVFIVFFLTCEFVIV